MLENTLKLIKKTRKADKEYDNIPWGCANEQGIYDPKIRKKEIECEQILDDFEFELARALRRDGIKTDLLAGLLTVLDEKGE